MQTFRMVNTVDGAIQTMNAVQAKTAHGWVCLFEIGPPERRPDRVLPHPSHRVKAGYPYFDTDLDELIFWMPAPGSAPGGEWIDVDGDPISARRSASLAPAMAAGGARATAAA